MGTQITRLTRLAAAGLSAVLLFATTMRSHLPR